MMKYKGYHAEVTYDHEAAIFHGEVVGTRDVIFFEGTSVDQLNEEFHFSIDDYLAVCEERGRDSGQDFLRPDTSQDSPEAFTAPPPSRPGQRARA